MHTSDIMGQNQSNGGHVQNYGTQQPPSVAGMQRRPVQQQQQQRRPVQQQQTAEPRVRRAEYKKKSEKFYQVPQRTTERLPMQTVVPRRTGTSNRYPDTSVVIEQPSAMDYRGASHFQEDTGTYRGNRGATVSRGDRMAFDPSVHIQAPSAESRGGFHGEASNVFNPYAVLGVSENVTMPELVKMYRHLAKLNHPDKGGDAEVFEDIKQAYNYIKNKIEESDDYRIHQPVRKMTYDQVNNDHEGMIHQGLSAQEKFNQTKFNQVFEKSRLDDPNMDRGYGHLMDATQRSKSDAMPTGYGDEEFDDDAVYDIIEYQEPKAYTSSATSLGYVDLDNTEVNDFTGNGYTDYKRAFHKRNHIDTLPEGAEIEGRARNLEQYKNQRSNISHELTPEEARRQEILRQKQEEAERERRRRYEERRRNEQRHFQNTHRRMITE